ncbi:GspJ family T2SS minor pseudopilin variant LspJ [Legionella dresdenensis]|uniref:Type II secretion system protein J n=1 Tax=Legionella dresdenensis TaxID=450200 RepID=A0ABV8CBG5_9GAMM
MNRKNGFTLIEILIALAVFAILATITSSAMYYAFSTRSRLNTHADKLTELQIALTLIARDAEQVVNRPVHKGESILLPAFIGKSNYVELTRNGIANPGAVEQRSTLKRVALICSGKQLIRRSWTILDANGHKQYQDKVLLDDLTKCRISYLSATLQILQEWHETVSSRREPLPKAIQLDITLKNWGNMNFLFIIPKAVYGRMQI